DPLARHDFMASVMAAVAEDGVSVVLSSHVLADLERVADYLILLSAGQVQVAGEVDDLLAGHRMLAGPAEAAGDVAARVGVVRVPRAGPRPRLRVGSRGAPEPALSGGEASPGGGGGLVLASRRAPGAGALPGLWPGPPQDGGARACPPLPRPHR